jgi:hypothetical protein
MSSNVVPLGNKPEQLALDGFPVVAGNTSFDLSNTKRLVTAKVLSYNEAVSGRFSGRVKGLRTVEIGKGEGLAVSYLVEVLEADLDE